MRSRLACARRLCAGLLTAVIMTLMVVEPTQAAVTGAAFVAAPAAFGMGWLVGLAIFPPAALLALTFLVALLTDRMA